MKQLVQSLGIAVCASLLALVGVRAFASGGAECVAGAAGTGGGDSGIWSCAGPCDSGSSSCAVYGKGTNSASFTEVHVDENGTVISLVRGAGTVNYSTCECGTSQDEQCCDIVKINSGASLTGNGKGWGTMGACEAQDASCPPGDLCSANVYSLDEETGQFYASAVCVD